MYEAGRATLIIDPSELDPQSVYKLLIGSVVPRPIAWTSTLSPEGVPNLAPYSFFTVASRNPPTLCVSVGERPSGEPFPKDTLRNIEETGEFVVNVVSVSLSNAMHESSKDHPPGADEFEAAALTVAPCEVVKAPRVGEASVSMECVLDRVLPIGTDNLVLGRMVRVHVRDELYGKTGRIDVACLDPLGRLAGNYTKVETIFELPLEDL